MDNTGTWYPGTVLDILTAGDLVGESDGEDGVSAGARAEVRATVGDGEDDALDDLRPVRITVHYDRLSRRWDETYHVASSKVSDHPPCTDSTKVYLPFTCPPASPLAQPLARPSTRPRIRSPTRSPAQR